MSPAATEIAARHHAAMASLTAEQRAAIARHNRAANVMTFTTTTLRKRLEQIFETEAQTPKSAA